MKLATRETTTRKRIISLLGLTLAISVLPRTSHACMDWVAPETQDSRVPEDAPPDRLDLADLSDFSDFPEFKHPFGLAQINSEGQPSTQNYLTPEMIFQVGRAVWPIVEAGKPIVNLGTDWASAYPGGVKSWEDLQGWQTPVSKTFSFHRKTFFGNDMVRFTYQVVFTPGGSLQGKGSYIANATIVPNDVFVLWGHKFYANIEVSKVLNAGTPDDPVAAMQLNLTCRIENALTHHQSSSSFYLTGKGDLTPIRR